MAKKTFELPDLGEGLREAVVREWHVSVGDDIAVDKIVVKVETQKSAVEIPSPWSGKITALNGAVGDEITVGAVLFEVETGDGVDTEVPRVAESQKSPQSVPAEKPHACEARCQEPLRETPRIENQGGRIRAMPAARILLREKGGTNFTTIRGTGPGGVLMRSDVEAFVSREAPDTTEESAPDDGWKLLVGIRKAMAENMGRAHREVVPVSRFGKAKLRYWKSTSDTTPRIVRAIVTACKVVPALNAHYDSARSALKTYKEVNLGIAVDTEAEDLVVPVLEHADRFENLDEIRGALRVLVEPARKGHVISRAKPTITLSNIGPIGEDEGGSAVVIPPQVAIVVASRIREEVCVFDGVVETCKVLPLSLTFDHRVITGATALRFMGALIEALESFEDHGEGT